MLWEGGGGQEAGPLLPRKLVLVLYSPLDTILPFHPFCPKSEHWGPVALTCLPSTPGTLEGRKGLEHSPDPPYVGPAVGVCDLPCPPTSSSTIPSFIPPPPVRNTRPRPRSSQPRAYRTQAVRRPFPEQSAEPCGVPARVPCQASALCVACLARHVRGRYND